MGSRTSVSKHGSSGVETASHAGHCLINLVNIKTEHPYMYIYMFIWEVGQVYQNMSHYFHTTEDCLITVL